MMYNLFKDKTIDREVQNILTGCITETQNELAKKFVTELSEVLLQSDIQPPSTWAGRSTDSTKPPFSDKLMMYISSLISGSAIGYNALGTSFSMRSDLHTKLALISKETFDYSKKGEK